MNLPFQTALKLNQIIEEKSSHYIPGVKCHLFYTPSLDASTQHKMRISLEQRQNLRKTVLNTLLNEGTNLSQKQKKNLCDTQLIPTLSNGSISISHCSGLKGFVYNLHTSLSHLKNFSLPKNIQTEHQGTICQKTSFKRTNSHFRKNHIGLDVEVTSRVRTSHVSFLSKKIELDKMPSPSCLWTAKEASFKCLYPIKLSISKITINHWAAISNNFFDFYFSAPHKIEGKGYCLLWKQWTIAFAVL